MQTAEQKELIAIGQKFLAGAPREVPLGASNLFGFSGPVGFICSECAGRILARGCDLNRLAKDPVWGPAKLPKCDLCGQ